MQGPRAHNCFGVPQAVIFGLHGKCLVFPINAQPLHWLPPLIAQLQRTSFSAL